MKRENTDEGGHKGLHSGQNSGLAAEYHSLGMGYYGAEPVTMAKFRSRIDRGRDDLVVATVEGRPRVEEVLPLVTAPAVELVPLMLVAAEATPTIRLSTAPMVRIRNTLTPATAPTRTTR